MVDYSNVTDHGVRQPRIALVPSAVTGHRVGADARKEACLLYIRYAPLQGTLFSTPLRGINSRSMTKQMRHSMTAYGFPGWSDRLDRPLVCLTDIDKDGVAVSAHWHRKAKFKGVG